MYGHGYGTFNGNGQVWYDFIGSASNYPRRPHQITFNGLKHSVIENINFWQSQMWTMTLIHSSNVLLQDIHVNNTNLKGGADQNTDGADTIYSNNITFARWTVQNGDDGISWKANSTNVLVDNSTFHRGSGLALGSIGQFKGQYETIVNVTARNCYFHYTIYGAYAKTWTGVQQGYPPNGGGGGTGLIKNITFENFVIVNATQLFYTTQCNSYIGATGGCDTSKFQIEDMKVTGMKGVLLKSNVTASMQCSGAAPCHGIEISDTHMTDSRTGLLASRYLCSNVTDPIGFTCTGLTPQT